MAISAIESELPGGPARVVKAASGWWTVVTVAEGFSLAVRGWSGEKRFVALYDIRDGGCKAGSMYWWSRQHTAKASQPDQEVRWTTEKMYPTRVSVRELLLLLRNK